MRTINLNNVESKKRVTITATDRIGRTESITLVLPANMADRLLKSFQSPDDFGEINDYRFTCALNEIYDSFKEWRDYPSNIKINFKPIISKSQFYKLSNFYNLAYHKFYKYMLSVTVK